MKIKTRLHLSIILSLILTVTIGMFVIFALQKMNAEIEKGRTANKIVKSMAELKIVAHEYLLHPTDRSLMQWNSTYDYLTKSLMKKANEFESPAEKIALGKILMNIERFKAAFNNVTTSFGKEQGFGRQESAISPDLRDRFISEFLVISQATVSPVFQLQKVIQTELMAAQQKSGLLVVIFLIILAFFVIAISLWINRSIARPIAELEKDIRIFGSGNLDHKVGTTAKDEIGKLSRSFDMMTEDLKETTTSIAELNKEITDRKQVEEALRESEAQKRAILDGITTNLAFVNENLEVLWTNKVAVDSINSTLDEMIGRKCYELWADPKTPCDSCPTLKAFKTKKSEQSIMRTPDGRVWDEKGVPVFDENGEIMGVLEIAHDITEKINAEEELRASEERLARSKKMEAMGLMAGGVAHDLNNILSGIVSYPELILMDLPEDSPLRKPIKTIQESGMRAADVVEDLLTIARGVATGKEVLNLNTMVEEYLDSAEHQNLEKIYLLTVFKTELDSELLNITGSATHIKKILMNLIVNASEAIDGQGTVTVSTINLYLDEPLRGYEDVREGEYVVLAILDDGSGISPKDLDRIFEPFYTKKEMGRSGTGLGLAVVWNTVQDHKGYINVESNEKGTVFELYFPVIRKSVSDEKEKTPLENYLGHGEKILVVDDEERQRVIACGILTKLGYMAEAVSSGEESIEYVKENPVDLIVLDMVMPKGINGRKTYEEIIKIRPGQKAVIASGYAKTKEVDLAQELGAGKYIKKPYTLEKIGVAIKEELEK
jgi:two-component system, cell cycle sensor histidine kinase and response regulator CckA